MGLSLNVRRPFWSCWRDSEHRGRDPSRLIMALIGCTWSEAKDLVARGDSSNIDEWEAVAGQVLGGDASPYMREKEEKDLHLPEEFRPLWRDNPGAQRFLAYLKSRGFDRVQDLAHHYDLRFCRSGYFAQRLVLPVRYENVLVNWTARDITGHSELRYKTLSQDPETAKRQGCAPAPLAINDTVFNYDRAAEGGRTLAICEGPFDALKVDWFAEKEDAAVAVFGMPKPAQLAILLRLARRFERVRIMLDAAATSRSMQLLHNLDAVLGKRVRWLNLPKGVKDPGALPGAEVPLLLNA